MFKMQHALFLAGLRLGIGEAISMMPPPPVARAQRPHIVKRGFHRNRTTWHLTNGKRERERRLRQIERGQLKAENGLEVNRQN